MFYVVGVRGMGSFSEGHCLEVVGTGRGIRYVCLVDIAYPDCVNLGAGFSLAGVFLAIYVAVLVLATSVVAEPACWGPATSFGGAVALLQWFSFFSAIRGLCFASAIIALSSRAGEFLSVCMARIWDASRIWAVAIKDRGERGVLIDGGSGDSLG